MSLDYSNLERALAQLEVSLAYCAGPLAHQDGRLADQFRAAAIQAFEFTYELSHRMLRRHVAAASPNPQTVHDMPFAELIREGYGLNLLQLEWKDWREFRRLRSITSHTYDSEKAAEVFAAIPRFVQEARYLLGAMKRRDA